MRNVPPGSDPLRIAVFGSHWRGCLLAHSLRELEATLPGDYQVVGVATDDMIDPQSRVSRTKRVWQYIDPRTAEALQMTVAKSNLDAGIPVYTGPVKSEYFREVLRSDWRPGAIFMGTFGQLIDAPVFDFPEFGMYNFHPSDLARGRYPGPNPFAEMIEAGERSTCVTIHHVDSGFDTGEVVGRSLDIATGHETLSALPVGRSDLLGAWIDSLHCVTGFAARDLASYLAQVIREQGRRVSAVDLSGAFSREDRAYYSSAVVTQTVEALTSRGLLRNPPGKVRRAPGGPGGVNL